MMVAVMLVIAAGVAAWVLAPLRFAARDAAVDPTREPHTTGRGPRAAQDGDPWPPSPMSAEEPGPR
jgi:hypothetical protein